MKVSVFEKQIDEIKTKHPKHLVWVKMNGFVQCIKNDAEITSSILGCVLTERPDNKMKITGFNENMLDECLPKVIKKRFSVAMLDYNAT
jgi:DNA mismatch repair ATPase MutS